MRSTVTSGGGIYTETTGVAPNRTFKIEWRARHYVSGQALAAPDTNFAVFFHEGSNSFEYVYASTGAGGFAGGISATVGIQAANTGSGFTQFSFNTASLSPGQKLSFVLPINCPQGTGACAASAAISGTVTYGNAIGAPAAPRFVKNVSVASTVGSPAVGPVITGTPGTYTLTGFGAGSYTVKPTKPAGANTAITSNDAARVAEGVSGSVPFVSLNQKFASDASGNGTVSSNDAALVARFAAGLSGVGNVGQWKFFTANLPGSPSGPLPTPPYNDSRNYASVVSNVTGEDYIGILVGEASGNYNPATHPRGTMAGGGMLDVSGAGRGAGRTITVAAQPVVATAGKEIVVPVSVDGAAGKEIVSYEFDLRYDSSIIHPLKDPVDVTGTVSRGLMVVTNPKEPGLLRVVVYGPMPIEGDGVLLNFRFAAVGSAGSSSPLTFERVMFNDGEPRASVADGRVELF